MAEIKTTDQWVQNGTRIKAWFLMREDLGMSTGKFGVQVGHGTDYIHLTGRHNDFYAGWMDADVGNRRKIVLRAKNLEEIERIKVDCEAVGMMAILIGDAGLTEFDGPTITGMVICPHADNLIPKSLKRCQAWKDEPKLVDQIV